MIPDTHTHTVPTSHGDVAVHERGSGPCTLFMIHGNSSSAEAFLYQFGSPLLERYRLVAVDLPGHGVSGDATQPQRTYTRPGFADALMEVLAQIDLPDPVLLGWSLGGHIALEMAPRLPSLRGAMICGTPPVGRDMAQGFQPGTAVRYGSREYLTGEELEAFGRSIFGDALDASLRAAMARADGSMRRILFEAARAGAGVDQRQVVERLAPPLAIVNGADDHLINLDYIDSIAYANLWSGTCHRLPGAGHAPFREVPAAFNALLARFLADIAADAAHNG
jgi:pimeloyl-ACP methyl ester carboxylesterase